MPISEASLQDIPELERLINNAYRGEHSKKGWTTEADLLGGLRIDADSLEDIMHHENAVILKYCNKENIIEGCVYLERNADKMYLGMLTVSPEKQTQGIGKQLLFAAEKHAALSKCSSVEMTVISVRYELIKWYEKHGYYKTGKTKPFPGDTKFGVPKQPLEFIVLQKDLHNSY